MGKRFAVILVLLLISALAVLGYFLQQGRKSLFTDPYKVISSDATIVIETIDFQNLLNTLLSGKGLFDEVNKIEEFEKFNSKIKYLSDKLESSDFQKVINDGSSLISFYPVETGGFDVLLSLSLPGEIHFRQVKDILRSSGIKTIIEANREDFDFLRIPYQIKDKRDTIYVSVLSGLFVCSTSENLLDDAAKQLQSESDIRDLPGFSRVLLASGKNEDKIFLVFSNLFKTIKAISANGSLKLAEKIAGLAGTVGGDFYINDDGIVVSGFIETIDSSDLLFKYKSLDVTVFDSYKILPSSTVLFESMVIPAYDKLTKTDFMTLNNKPGLYGKLREFIGDEICRAQIDSRDTHDRNNELVIYELSNRVQAEQIFISSLEDKKDVIHFTPDDQIRIPVYKTDYNDLDELFFKRFSSTQSETYFTFYDNFLISGNSYSAISKILYDNILNKTLANDLTYRDFESTLPSRAGYIFYCVPSLITDYLASFLDDKIINTLLANKNSLDKIQALGYQLASSNGMIYNSLSIKYQNEAREESTTEWETLLDTVAAIKPFFFINHITGAREIFIQDLKNNIYLINAAGRVLWKVPLRERISGSIYMIDYYKNGKFQLLFSGRNYLHILDRNGNYVERFPLKLRSPATNSLALFDYDNNLNYRLFIAGEDKLIYSYDKTGNVVKGWKAFKTSDPVNSEINYFRVSGKDYIVISDESAVYFLDRTGNKRVTLKGAVARAKGSSMRLNSGSEPSVICSSPDGTIQNIYFDGTIKKFSLEEFSEEHFFDFFDIDGDGFGEYIFIDKGILYLYDHNKSMMFSREFGSTNLGGPINFVFSAADRKIGVFDIDNKLIYLIGKDGSTMNGFPLKGASMFSIGKLSDKSGWHLIVGGTDRFMYNYKIDSGIK